MKSPSWQDMPQSGNIAAAAHDRQTGELLLRFKSGATYAYSGVPWDTFQSLLSSPSPGGFLNRHIIPNHGTGKKL
jgi:hypothetical protein